MTKQSENRCPAVQRRQAELVYLFLSALHLLFGVQPKVSDCLSCDYIKNCSIQVATGRVKHHVWISEKLDQSFYHPPPESFVSLLLTKPIKAWHQRWVDQMMSTALRLESRFKMIQSDNFFLVMLQSISTSTVSACFNANFRDIQPPTTVQLPCPWRVQLFSSAPASGPTKVCRGLQQRSKEYCWLKQPAATPTGGCETSGEASFFNVMSHAAKFKSCSLRQCFFMRDSMHEKYEPSLSCQILSLFSGLSDHSSTRIVKGHPNTLLCSKPLGAALSMAIPGNANACAPGV